jgi:hypothetical protein
MLHSHLDLGCDVAKINTSPDLRDKPVFKLLKVFSVKQLQANI